MDAAVTLTTWPIRLLSAALGVALLAAMLGPFQDIEGRMPVSDVAAHAIAFAIITATCLIHLPRTGRLTAIAISMTIGLLVELIQHFTGRGAELHDVVADLAGTMAVATLWWRRPWLAARPSPPEQDQVLSVDP